MPEWLVGAGSNGQDLSAAAMAGRLLLALAMGAAVAGLYGLTRRPGEPPAWSFVSTLALLAILLAMVTQVIGDNVARAFSLVGALSIVRFRTVVEDTRDTAFVIFAVVIGMAVGVGRFPVAVVGFVVVALACLLMKERGPNRRETGAAGAAVWRLAVRAALAPSPETALASAFAANLHDVQLLSAATGRQGASIDLSYRTILRETVTPAGFVSELNLIEGVQSVELRLAASD